MKCWNKAHSWGFARIEDCVVPAQVKKPKARKASARLVPPGSVCAGAVAVAGRCASPLARSSAAHLEGLDSLRDSLRPRRRLPRAPHRDILDIFSSLTRLWSRSFVCETRRSKLNTSRIIKIIRNHSKSFKIILNLSCKAAFSCSAFDEFKPSVVCRVQHYLPPRLLPRHLSAMEPFKQHSLLQSRMPFTSKLFRLLVLPTVKFPRSISRRGPPATPQAPAEHEERRNTNFNEFKHVQT